MSNGIIFTSIMIIPTSFLVYILWKLLTKKEEDTVEYKNGFRAGLIDHKMWEQFCMLNTEETPNKIIKNNACRHPQWVANGLYISDSAIKELGTDEIKAAVRCANCMKKYED